MRAFPSVILLLAAGFAHSPASAAGPADELLRLAPVDAAVTVVAERLGERYRELARSPLADGLERLPAIRSLASSERYRELKRVGQELSTALGTPIEKAIESLAGRAVVVAFLPGPPDRPEQSRAILLSKVSDRVLVERVIDKLAEAQRRSGELLGIDSRSLGSARYAVRNFRPGTRPSDFYAHLPNDVFVWTNSEAWIRQAIDQQARGAEGLLGIPAFARVRAGLPPGAMLGAYIDPGWLSTQLRAGNAPRSELEGRIFGLLTRYLGAVSYAGAALEWRDGFVLHTHEALDARRLDPWLRQWLTKPVAPVRGIEHVPATAMAVLAAEVDPSSWIQAILDTVPEPDRPRLANLGLIAQGLLLGRDPATRVLPRLGPSMLAFAEFDPRLPRGTRLPVAGVLTWTDPPGEEPLGPALDNALRTFLASRALGKPIPPLPQVETRRTSSGDLTSLSVGPRSFLAYRIGRDEVVLGSTVEVVEAFGQPRPSSELLTLRDREFPGAETFAMVDLPRFSAAVRRYRRGIATRLAERGGRTVSEADRDLDPLLQLADLFRFLAFSSRGDTTAIHRTLGLYLR
jgi:hypothetical protein